MNIGLIGSGGREHALCQKIYESKLCQKKFFVFLVMQELQKLQKILNVDILNFKKFLKLIKIYKIDLVIVGPEEPLVKGLVDFLKKIKLKFLVQINMHQN